MTKTPRSFLPAAPLAPLGPLFGAALSMAAVAAVTTTPVYAAEVIKLTQTGCQFVEPEGKDHGFKTGAKADCERINAKNGAARVAKSEVMTLKPGAYVFRVTNKNVPYPLGFWFRSEGYSWKNPLHKLTKTSVSGGGLTTGKTGDYKITLKPGAYVFSCPLNTTPDYKLIVTKG